MEAGEKLIDAINQRKTRGWRRLGEKDKEVVGRGGKQGNFCSYYFSKLAFESVSHGGSFCYFRTHHKGKARVQQLGRKSFHSEGRGNNRPPKSENATYVVIARKAICPSEH